MDAADFLLTRPATFLAGPVCACTDVRKHLTTNLSEDQEGQSKGEDGRRHYECAVLVQNRGRKMSRLNPTKHNLCTRPSPSAPLATLDHRKKVG